MNKTKNVFTAILMLANSLFFLSSCDNTDESPIPAGEYSKGVFITNEGRFNGNDGEISFYNTSTKTVSNKLFSAKNQFTLGDVVQSMLIHQDKGYIVVNNSNKVEVVDINTIESAGTVSNLELPRYMVAQGNKGYVTEWVDFVSNGRIAVIDLSTNTVTNTIPVGNLPEQLIIVNDQLYVANSADNTVTVINLSAETVSSTIPMGNNPASIKADKDGNIWVLSGYTSSNSTLIKFNPASPSLQTIYNFSSSGASNLTLNGEKNKVYYSYNDAVYGLDINATALNNTPVINRNFYGIGIAPDEAILYGAIVPGFSSDGRVIRYNLNTNAAIDSVNVSVAPNGFVFQ